MVSRLSGVSTVGYVKAPQSPQAIQTQTLRFGTGDADSPKSGGGDKPTSWWSRIAKPFLRGVFMYDLPYKAGIDELVTRYPDNKEAKTLQKHARWSENALRLLNWANWALILTLPIPFVHIATGPALLGLVVVEIGARIGLESHISKRFDKLSNELSKSAKA